MASSLAWVKLAGCRFNAIATTYVFGNCRLMTYGTGSDLDFVQNEEVVRDIVIVKMAVATQTILQ